MGGSETTSFPVTDANPHGNKRVEITLANGHDIYVQAKANFEEKRRTATAMLGGSFRLAKCSDDPCFEKENGSCGCGFDCGKYKDLDCDKTNYQGVIDREYQIYKPEKRRLLKRPSCRSWSTSSLAWVDFCGVATRMLILGTVKKGAVCPSELAPVHTSLCRGRHTVDSGHCVLLGDFHHR